MVTAPVEEHKETTAASGVLLPAKLRSVFLSERRYPWHIISIMIISAVACLLFYRHFGNPGTLLHVDMSFPTSLDRIYGTLRSMWYPYGSLAVVWNALSVLWLYPSLLLAKLFGMSSSTYLWFLFISTFALAGISMYTLAYNIIKEFDIAGTSRLAVHAGAVIAALIYMYNPWSLGHLWGYFGYPAYAVMPIVFLLLVKAVDTRKLYLVVLLVLLVAVTSTAPICVVWYMLLIATYAVFYLITKRFNRESVLGTLKVMLQTAVLYLVVNALWLVPFLGSQLTHKPIVPVYNQYFTQSMAEGLSASNNIINNLRLSGWGGPNNIAFNNQLATILSFALPVFSIVALYILRDRVSRNRKMVFMGVFFVLSILIATGTSFILKRPYEFFELRAPGSAALGWVIRAPDRFLFFVPAFYASILGAMAASIMKKRPQPSPEGEPPFAGPRRSSSGGAGSARDADDVNRELLQEVRLLRERILWFDQFAFNTRAVVYVVVFAFLLLSLYPLTLLYAQNVFNPTRIPADYQKVNDFITKQDKDARVVWTPFAGFAFTTNWALEKRIGPFNVFGSNPSLYNLQDMYNKDSYLYWLQDFLSKSPGAFAPVQILNKDIMVTNDIASRLLMPFAARYLILDTSVKDYDFGGSFTDDKSLKEVYATGILKVYEIANPPPLVSAASRTVRVDTYFDQLAIVQKYVGNRVSRLCFTKATDIPKALGLLDVDLHKEFMDINGSFELGDPTTNVIPFWVLGDRSGNVKMFAEKRFKVDGKRSLRVENSSTQSFGIGWVSGQPIQVQEGSIYSFESKVRFRNATWTSVAIEGLKRGTNEWVPIAIYPTIQSGSAGWKRYQCSFLVPGTISKIRPALAAGWVKDKTMGIATSWFDNIRLARIDTGFFRSIETASTPPKVTFKRLNPQKYQVHVENAVEPFMLSFGEAYDPQWVARYADGSMVLPVRLYSMTNGFPVIKAGTFDLMLEFRPQKWFNYGFIVSLLVILMLLIYLLYYWVRRGGRLASSFGGFLKMSGHGVRRGASRVWDYVSYRPEH